MIANAFNYNVTGKDDVAFAGMRVGKIDLGFRLMGALVDNVLFIDPVSPPLMLRPLTQCLMTDHSLHLLP